MSALGIDYGGTHTKLLLVDDAGEEIARDMLPTSSLEGLGDGVSAFLHAARADVRSFALTVAGTLDAGTGIVGRSTNLPWLDGVAPADVLSRRLGIRGIAVQDGEASALAEARFGAGRGSDDVFVIVLGTGIAGAHVRGGAVHRGAHGAAGEIGHIRVAANAVTCSCGQVGCLETAIGGYQLGARWIERGGGRAGSAGSAGWADRTAGGDTDGVDRTAGDGIGGRGEADGADLDRRLADAGHQVIDGGPGGVRGGAARGGEAVRGGDASALAEAQEAQAREIVSARDVVAAAEAGDAAAVAVLDDAAGALGRALLDLSALVDPGLIVIGGGVARSPEWTVAPAVEFARAHATFHVVPEVRAASLGVWAGARGAAASASAAGAASPAATGSRR